MTNLKNKVIIGWNFIERTVRENKLRTGAVFCMILVLFSFFLPFMSVKADVSVTGLMDNTITILTPENELMTLNLGDFVLQKPIDDIEVFNIPLGDIKIFDRSVLTILRSPLPDKGIIANIDQTLSSSALNFLVDPKVQEIIATRLPRGNEINIILENTYNIIQEAKNVVAAANTVVTQAQESMAEVNATIATIDGYKSTANGVILFIFIMGIGLILLLVYKRAPLGISIGISSVLFIIFLGVGFTVSAVNDQINTQLLELTTQINTDIVESLRGILAGTLGDMGNFIANFIGTRGNFLSMALFIQLDLGYWLILLGLGVVLILTIILAVQNRKNNQAKELEEAVMVNEIVGINESPEINEVVGMNETAEINEITEINETTEDKDK